jgi:sugar phosphate isomerase/epimerase
LGTTIKTTAGAIPRHIYLEILDQIDSPWLGVQYDASNAILAEDPIELLEIVKHRVVTLHASNRFLKPGHNLDELNQVEDSVGYAAILSHGVGWQRIE